jgi:DNA repair protein RecN (Recombination protein N)
MLDELRVQNLGIIASGSIEPGSGLVAVTGETGTGKTLLLGALRMLRGDTASLDRIGPHGDEAHAEGRFLIGEDEIIAARRLTASRSRAYLDGDMVPAKALASRLAGIVEIVAQHEHVTLGRESSLRRLLDGGLDPSGVEAQSGYSEAYRALRDLEAEAAGLGGDERTMAREVDLLRHQAAEVAAAAPQPAEDEELLVRLRTLRHAGEISESLGAAIGALDDEDQASDLSRLALDRLRDAAKLDPALDGLAGRLETAIADVGEIVGEAKEALVALDLDGASLEQAENRFAVLSDLKRKYGATIAEVLTYAEDAASRADALEHTLTRVSSISAEIAAARQHAVDIGRALADARRIAADRLASEATERLRRLGFRDPLLRFTITEGEPAASGTDRIQLEFASDASLTPGPVAKVASGGELSRLVLAIRVAAGVAEAPVVAFDEVDAGIGGATALAMAEELAALAESSQVLVVTHLPQVAAFADRHFVVDRSGASASIRRVEGEERLGELARMLGGLEESERGRLHAEELVQLAAKRRGA